MFIVHFENQVSFDGPPFLVARPIVDSRFGYFAQRSGVTTDQTLVDVEVIRAAGVEETYCAV